MRSTMTAPMSATYCLRGLRAARFEVVKSLGTNGEPLAIAFVPLGDPRVEIPAVVIESRGVGNGADLADRLPFELPEAHDDVGDLDAEVVDVVLRLDRRAQKAKDAHERVAERGVPQMADMRGLVRVDGGVFDDGPGDLIAVRHDPAGEALQQIVAPIEIEVQISVRRGDHSASRPGCRPARRRAPGRWHVAPCGAFAPAERRRSRRGRRARGWAALQSRTPERRRCRSAGEPRRQRAPVLPY